MASSNSSLFFLCAFVAVFAIEGFVFFKTNREKPQKLIKLNA
jgi:hypothetical protein